MKPVCPKCKSTDFYLGRVNDRIRICCNECKELTFPENLSDFARFFPSPQWRDVKVEFPETRFQYFDDPEHPANIWWEKHGQYMLSGGGRREFIWACRGWIAREQLAAGVEVTGDSLLEKAQKNNTALSGPEGQSKEQK